MDTALLIADLKQICGWELAMVPPGPRSGEDAQLRDASGEGPRPEDVLEAQLAEKINELIQRDFGALVQLLYRIDVQEKKLRRILDENNGEDAGLLIARLIMERQWQKIESRQQYRQEGGAGAEGEERW